MNKRPNIIFILNDHQAYYRHGWDGGIKPKRPCFEEFAENGINFANAYTVTPMCGPARRSLLTALYPHKHGQIHNENDPPYNHEVYLDILAENGYKNYYYGKWHAGPGTALDHHCEGFSYTGYGNPYITKEYEDYINRYKLPKAQHLVEKVFATDAFKDLKYFPKLKEGELYSCEDRWCGEHAVGKTVTPKETHEAFFLAGLACEKLEEIAQSSQKEPFALRVDFWGPHQPFFPTQEFLDMYNPEEIQMYGNFDTKLEGKPETLRMEYNKPIGDGKKIIYPNPIPWAEWQQILARCYAHITMVDAAGGMVLKKVKELGLDDNTIIIWSTDHGDAIACQGGHFDKHSHMAQEVMRIPLAMQWKNIIPGGIEDAGFVTTMDIPVTMLAAAGLAFTDRIDGISLLDAALDRGYETRRDSLLCETYGHGYGVTIIGRMVVNDKHKYVHTIGDKDELYDLTNDPYELRNLVDEPGYQNILEDMKRLLRVWQRHTEDPVEINDKRS